MIVRRHAIWLATAALTSGLLAACGGSDDDPSIKPTSGTSSTSAPVSADPDGFSPQQREVADAVQAYNQATFGANGDQVATGIEGLVTPEVLSGVTQATSDGTSYTGVPTVVAERVTVDGKTATFVGCRDGSNVYGLKKGQTEAGAGSVTVGFSRLTFTLVRDDDRWIISDPRGEQVPTC